MSKDQKLLYLLGLVKYSICYVITQYLAECGLAPNAAASFECESGELVITWPTNLVYPGNMTSIPQRVADTLQNRLVQSHYAPSVVLVNSSPP